MTTRRGAFHITHVGNLPAIIDRGGLLSDARMIHHGGPTAAIGMSSIKHRRLTLPVPCHPGTCVGDYVPFYLCPRSIMLYVLHRANHPEVAYQGGQRPIVHLVADLAEVITWADAQPCRWAVSRSNAGSPYATIRTHADALAQLDWTAIDARDFRDPLVKDGKQAELLLHDMLPWHLIRGIGVYDDDIARQARAACAHAAHRPPIAVRRDWYY